MEKLKVAILEDNKALLKNLKDNIEDNNLGKVVVFATNSEDFVEGVKSKNAEVLMLDIDLGNQSLTGIEVANKLKLPAMFVSGNNQNNLKEIEKIKFNLELPVSHITKPFSDEDFIKAARIFINEVAEKLKSQYVTLNFKNNGKEKIQFNSIVYIESSTEDSSNSNNKKIFFNNRKPEILCDFSFSKMSYYGFPDIIFITTHKSYRVNVNQMIRYNNNHTADVYVINEKGNKELISIPVSENYRKSTKNSF
jgi:CheY-like chemotaxis protein